MLNVLNLLRTMMGLKTKKSSKKGEGFFRLLTEILNLSQKSRRYYGQVAKPVLQRLYNQLTWTIAFTIVGMKALEFLILTTCSHLMRRPPVQEKIAIQHTNDKPSPDKWV